MTFSRSSMHRPSSNPLIYDVREFRSGKALKNLLQLNRTLTKGERGLCYLWDYTYQILTHVFNEPTPWKFLESVSAVLIRWRWSDHVGRGLDWWMQEMFLLIEQTLSKDYRQNLACDFQFSTLLSFFIPRFFLYLSSSAMFFLSFLLTFRSLLWRIFASAGSTTLPEIINIFIRYK